MYSVTVPARRAPTAALLDDHQLDVQPEHVPDAAFAAGMTHFVELPFPRDWTPDCAWCAFWQWVVGLHQGCTRQTSVEQHTFRGGFEFLFYTREAGRSFSFCVAVRHCNDSLRAAQAFCSLAVRLWREVSETPARAYLQPEAIFRWMERLQTADVKSPMLSSDFFELPDFSMVPDSDVENLRNQGTKPPKPPLISRARLPLGTESKLASDELVPPWCDGRIWLSTPDAPRLALITYQGTNRFGPCILAAYAVLEGARLIQAKWDCPVNPVLQSNVRTELERHLPRSQKIRPVLGTQNLPIRSLRAFLTYLGAEPDLPGVPVQVQLDLM